MLVDIAARRSDFVVDRFRHADPSQTSLMASVGVVLTKVMPMHQFFRPD
jgi:hypothetical protein